MHRYRYNPYVNARKFADWVKKTLLPLNGWKVVRG